MYDFFQYTDAQETNVKKKNSLGHDVILQLTENLPKHQNFKVCFDEWFCSLKLLRETKSMEYLVTVFI